MSCNHQHAPGRYPGGKVRDEIMHSRAHRVRTLLARPWHAILFSLHARRPTLAYSTNVSPSLSRISLDSATCNTENSMLFTPVSARVAHAIVARRGACITCNFCVVWRANIVDFPQIFANSAKLFHPGVTEHM